MSAYSVKLGRPHATNPTVAFQVFVWDLVAGGALNPEFNGHCLWVPSVDSWIPDTLRLVLWELSAYLPAHRPEDAIVRVEAKYQPRRGRAPLAPRSPRFDDGVVLSVETAGWRAEVTTNRNATPLPEGQYPSHLGRFSEPMQALLLELAAQGGICLARIAPEDSEDCSIDHRLNSRRSLQLGIEAVWDERAKDWREDIVGLIKRTRRILDDLEGDGSK